MTQIISKAVHISMTEAINNAIQDSFSPVLDNFEALVVEDIVVTIEDHSSQSTGKSEVKVRVPVKGNDIFVTAEGEDMYKTISEAASKTTKQMRNLKQKFNKKGGESIRHPEPEPEMEDEEQDLDS
jgi:ribosomal subunit interface protein